MQSYELVSLPNYSACRGAGNTRLLTVDNTETACGAFHKITPITQVLFSMVSNKSAHACKTATIDETLAYISQ